MKHSKEEFELSISVIEISMYHTYKQWLWMFSFINNNNSITIPYEVAMQQRGFAREAFV